MSQPFAQNAQKKGLKQMAVIQKFRKSFGKSFLQTPLPDLVEIQYDSYKNFLQADVDPQNRKNMGLQNVFSSMFPIKDYAGIADLEFVEYTLDKPVYNVKECMLRNMTYSSKLKLKLRLILWDIAEDGKKTLRDIKEQEIFMGEVPLMTERGSFIASGVERVIVSQMHRAQGVVFATTKEAKIAGNPVTYTARIIPEHGSWIDFEESKGVIYVRIDRRRKIPATVLLRCLPADEDEKKWIADPRKTTIRGMSDTEILGVFYKRIPLSFDGKLWSGDTASFEGLDKYRLNYDLINPKDKSVLASKGDRLNAKRMKKIMDASKTFGIMPESLVGEYLFDPIMSGDEVVMPAGTEITEEVLNDLDKMNIKEILNKVDHTLLSQTATWQEIKAICDDGIKYETASVCIPASFVKQAKEYVDADGNLLFRLNSPYYYATGAQWCTAPGLHLQFLLDKNYNAVDMFEYGFIPMLDNGPYFSDGVDPINYAYYDPINYGNYCFFVNDGDIYQLGILFSDMSGLTLGGEVWQWVEGYPGAVAE